jgi:hypothetical protein
MIPAMTATTMPGPDARTADGIDRAEALARQAMDLLINTTDIADLDTTIASMFLLRDVLACLEVYAGLIAPDAVRQIEHLTAARVAELRRNVAADPISVSENDYPIHGTSFCCTDLTRADPTPSE